jgi:hypothetical protein
MYPFFPPHNCLYMYHCMCDCICILIFQNVHCHQRLYDSGIVFVVALIHCVHASVRGTHFNESLIKYSEHFIMQIMTVKRECVLNARWEFRSIDAYKLWLLSERECGCVGVCGVCAHVFEHVCVCVCVCVCVDIGHWCVFMCVRVTCICICVHEMHARSSGLSLNK